MNESPYKDIPGRIWWKEAVIYQVYPRSFKDSNDDGMGDLPGILSKLGYIQSLGVDIVWLNPIYDSPNADNGYDIRDYRAIMKAFGTMNDFDALLNGMHERGLKLVMDLVVNHCSDEHEWFRQSRSSRTNPYRGYFHWWPAEKGKPPFRPGIFEVDGSGWRYDAPTDAYYLHYFSYKQPDLNWENSQLRKEIFDMMKFWFDKGVDGFRMDVIPYISKDTDFPVITQADLDERHAGDWTRYLASGPHLHDYLREMNREVLSKYNIVALAEGLGATQEEALKMVDPDRHELNLSYHFDGINLGYLPGEFKQIAPEGYSLIEFKRIYSEWDEIFATKGWGTIYLGNHDQPRMLTRWGNDSPAFRQASSKLLTTFLLSMRGTPCYYAGDEIGMSNIRFDKIEDYRDIETINMHEQVKNNSGDLKRFLEGQKISARDNGRTPFQWDASLYAGFSSSAPWLAVNPDYLRVNVALEEKDPDSILSYFRRMLRLRKENPVLIYGSYGLLNKNDPDVYAYTRELNSSKVLVLLNFRSETRSFALEDMQLTGEALISNYRISGSPGETVSLQPYQAVIYKLK